MRYLKLALVMAAMICSISAAAMAHAGHLGITLMGGNGLDTLVGTTHDDHLHGGNGPDMLRGRAGRDLLDGGRSGADVCIGGRGKDYFVNCETIRN